MTNYATMIARAATGRSIVVAIRGGYHGMAAWMQSSGNPGVIDGDVRNMRRIPWNDVAAFEHVLDENPGQVAAFISTPYHHPSFEDSALPAAGYWRRIRQLCDQHGGVLIIDDVRAGFRLDLRGSNEYFGFTPDLICLCKAIANGYPLSALVGREELKEDAAKVRNTGSQYSRHCIWPVSSGFPPGGLMADADSRAALGVRIAPAGSDESSATGSDDDSRRGVRPACRDTASQ